MSRTMKRASLSVRTCARSEHACVDGRVRDACPEHSDGFLDEVEMVSFFGKMAVDMTEEEQKACFKAADTSGCAPKAAPPPNMSMRTHPLYPSRRPPWRRHCTCCARACASACRDGKVSFDEFLVAFKASGQTVREAGESGLKGEFEFKNAAEML